MNVLEFAAPLQVGDDASAVRAYSNLARLDALDPVYFSDDAIVREELRAALVAFDARTEPETVDPFVDRFDKTLALHEQSIQRMFVGYGLQNIVLDMWKGNPEIFARMKSGIETLRQAVESHRKIADQLTDVGAFAAAIGRKLSTRGLPEPDGKLGEFAEWIYESPVRCPGLRLGYETTLALIENLEAAPKKGDFGDLCFVRAIPYVDAVTLDRRTRDICGRAVRKLNKQSGPLGYEDRMFRNVGDLVEALSYRAKR